MFLPIWTGNYPLRTFAVAILTVVLLQVTPAWAEPEAMSDGELDAVSALGFSFKSLSTARPPLFNNVEPYVATEAENETNITNLVFALTNTTNVNTAVNTCVYAVCENSGATIESNPVNETNLALSNQVFSTVQNLVSAPTLVSAPSLSSSTHAYPGGGAPPVRQPPARSWPTLPKFANGIR